jgi:hypothetical protein
MRRKQAVLAHHPSHTTRTMNVTISMANPKAGHAHAHQGVRVVAIMIVPLNWRFSPAPNRQDSACMQLTVHISL